MKFERLFEAVLCGLPLRIVTCRRTMSYRYGYEFVFPRSSLISPLHLVAERSSEKLSCQLFFFAHRCRRKFSDGHAADFHCSKNFSNGFRRSRKFSNGTSLPKKVLERLSCCLFSHRCRRKLWNGLAVDCLAGCARNGYTARIF